MGGAGRTLHDLAPGPEPGLGQNPKEAKNRPGQKPGVEPVLAPEPAPELFVQFVVCIQLLYLHARLCINVGLSLVFVFVRARLLVFASRPIATQAPVNEDKRPQTHTACSQTDRRSVKANERP